MYPLMSDFLGSEPNSATYDFWGKLLNQSQWHCSVTRVDSYLPTYRFVGKIKQDAEPLKLYLTYGK